MDKMWAGRFEKALDKQADDFNSSIHFDCRMYKQDITCSMVHAMMLSRQGIISSDEYHEILNGLSSILTDIENSFKSLPFEKVYIAEKNTNEWTPLSLLFVLDDNGTITQNEFVDLLEQDERINHANSWCDLPFETVDTRYIEKEKDTISVGETLQLTLKGGIDYYVH